MVSVLASSAPDQIKDYTSVLLLRLARSIKVKVQRLDGSESG